jgi:hypothetical protein
MPRKTTTSRRDIERARALRPVSISSSHARHIFDSNWLGLCFSFVPRICAISKIVGVREGEVMVGCIGEERCETGGPRFANCTKILDR